MYQFQISIVVYCLLEIKLVIKLKLISFVVANTQRIYVKKTLAALDVRICYCPRFLGSSVSDDNLQMC